MTLVKSLPFLNLDAILALWEKLTRATLLFHMWIINADFSR